MLRCGRILERYLFGSSRLRLTFLTVLVSTRVVRLAPDVTAREALLVRRHHNVDVDVAFVCCVLLKVFKLLNAELDLAGEFGIGHIPDEIVTHDEKY